MRKNALAAMAVLIQFEVSGQIREASERGIYPSGSFTVSEVETINNVNGNLFLSIPVVQMPPGRSAYAGPVRLNYNAALFDITLETPSGGGVYRKKLSTSEEGGWNYGFDYGVRVVSRPTLSGSANCSVAEDVNTYKYQLITPDGGKKELTLMGQAQADTTDGYYRVGPTGMFFNCPGYSPLLGSSTGTLIFYTTDGSFLRLEVPYNNAQNFSDQTWRLYLPDGGKVEGKAEYTTKVTDPKGWSVSYNRVFNPQNATTSFTIVEDQPPFRTITATTPSMAGSISTDTFTWQGFGSSLTTTVTWGAIDAGPHNYTCEAGSPQCQLSGSRTVVTSIKIPKASDGLPDFLYEFEYRDLAHCGGLKCYGQLGLLKLPTGNPTDRMQVAYEYQLDGLDLTPEYLDNPVKKKTTSYLEHFEGTPGGTVSRTESVNIVIGSTSSTFTNAETGGTVTHYFNDPRLMWDPKRGLTYRTRNADGSEVEKLWWRNPPSNTAAADPGNPYVRLEVSTLPDVSGVASRSSARQSTIEKNGNNRVVLDYDWVSYASIARSGGVLTGAIAGNLLRRVTNTYYNVAADADQGLSNPADSTAAYWNASAPRNLRAVKRSETGNDSLGIQAVVEFDYELPLFANTKTQERRWDSTKATGLTTPLSGSNSIITGYSYSCPGLVDTVTDPNGYQTKTDYGGSCLFPQWQKAAYGRPEERTTLFTYDSTGLLTQQFDQNNQVTTVFNYDRLGRRILTREAANSQEERQTVVEYDDVNRRTITKEDRVTTGDGNIISVSYFDSRGLGWLTLESENGTVPASGCTTGCVKVEQRSLATGGFFFEAVSNPYRWNSDSDSRGFSLTRKDAAGRVQEATSYSGLMAASWPWHGGAASLGSTLTSYNGETTTIQDAAGKSRTVQSDALGRAVSVNAGGVASTTNTFDSLGNLRQVVQGAQTRTFTYSSLSRLISSLQPENGSTGYTYDASGNLLTRTNGAAKAFEFKPPVSAPAEKAYDGLNRPRRKTIQQPVGADLDTVWTWDTAANGKGQLGSIAYGDTTISYSGYDSLGRVTSHTQTTAGTSYPFSYEYFRNDEVKKITYPSGRAVNYTLDIAGQLNGASAGATSYVGAATYAPHGGLRQMDLGGVNTLRAHWSAINGQLQVEQLTVSKLSAPAATLLGLGYTYGGSANNGNPVTHTVTAGGVARTQNYEYDAANRLYKACEANVGSTFCSVNPSTTWTGAGYGQVYGYDAYSNRWIEPTGTIPLLILMPTSSGAFNQSTNRFHPTMFGGTYDGAGQMTAQSSASDPITRVDEKWDAVGQRVESKYTFSGVVNTNVMVYDGLGNRVKKLNPVMGDTIFVYDAFGRMAAEYGAGSTAACSPCCLFTDPVGSVRLVVDQNQTVVKRYDSMPFGEQISAGTGWANGRTGAEYAPASTVKWRFAGSYKDDQSGEWPSNLMGARQYNPGYGRFVNPDENLMDQHAEDPLSWNLYSYGRNNPLRYSDPTGMKCVDNVDTDSGNFCVDVEGLKEKVQTAKKVITGSLLLVEPSIRLPGPVAQKTMDLVQEWMNRPRDPGCMAGAIGAGTTVGWWAGGGLGSAGFAGGPTGLATVPGGAAAGAAGGGALGGAAGLVICAIGGGGGGGGAGSSSNEQVKESAAKLGYNNRIPPQRAPFNSHGQPVFSNGQRFITPDVDSHIGGVWKMFDRSGKRLGTYDANLKRIGT